MADTARSNLASVQISLEMLSLALAQLTTDSVYRVREIIPKLNYLILVKNKIIPDLLPHCQVKTKRYPIWVYQELKSALGPKRVFPFMGLYLDGLVRKMLADSFLADWNVEVTSDLPPKLRSAETKWQDAAYPYFQYLYSCFCPDQPCPVNKERFNQSYGLFGQINKHLRQWFSYCQEAILFNQEYKVRKLDNNELIIAGHPDIVTENCVIDIKTSSGFKSEMAKQSLLQVFSYVALMRKAGQKVDYMALLLPLQGQNLLFNVQGWNSKPFLQTLFQQVAELEKRSGDMLTSDFMKVAGVSAYGILPNVGYTISKKDEEGKNMTWLARLQKYIQNSIGQGGILPCQIMLNGHVSTKVVLNDNDLAQINNTVVGFGLPLYIHAPYSINLAHPRSTYSIATFTTSKKKDGNKNWITDGLINILRAGQAMGARGVVVHTAKHSTKFKEYGKALGLSNMLNNLHYVLQYTNPECPLLLETPVGAGSEIAYQPEELSAIYAQFNSEERTKFKICVDTCHVFCAGYDPLEYLQQWEKLQGYQSIGLIHFNDSRKTKGCRVDGHQCYYNGRGNIGYPTMAAIAKWGNERKIAMVVE